MMETKPVLFNKKVISFVEKHASIDDDREIYGWLLGYETAQEIYVHAAYSCHAYQSQSLIGAEPNPKEVSAMNSASPLGIYNVGMYHSHPEGVYHSNTDNKTLLEISRMFPQVVSIVTNGRQTDCFRVVGNSVKQVEIKFESKKVDFIKYKFNLKLQFPKELTSPQIATKVDNLIEPLLEKNFSVDSPGIIDLGVIELGNEESSNIAWESFMLKQPYQSQKEFIKELQHLIYDMIILTKRDELKNSISSISVFYFDIPFILYKHSFAAQTFGRRANVLQLINRKEADELKGKLQNL